MSNVLLQSGPLIQGVHNRPNEVLPHGHVCRRAVVKAGRDRSMKSGSINVTEGSAPASALLTKLIESLPPSTI